MKLSKNLPNYLTYLRIAAIPALILVFFLKGNWGYWLASGIFLAASVTDWLDGYVARALNAQSNVGRFLDPIADKLIVATALLLLVQSNTDEVTRTDIISGNPRECSGIAAGEMENRRADDGDFPSSPRGGRARLAICRAVGPLLPVAGGTAYAGDRLCLCENRLEIPG